MAVQLLVKNGSIVSPSGTRRGHIVADRGVIHAVLESDGDLPEAETVIDAVGLHVLPGLVDPDVKFREPGLEYKEGWHYGSTAAVCGGITTVIEMPNPAVPIRNVDEFNAKLHAASGRSFCHYAVMATLSYADLNQVARLAEAGVCGYRCLLPGPFGPVTLMNSILDALRAVAETGLRCGVLPDSHDIIKHARDRVRAAGRHDGSAWRDARPPEAEVEGIARVLALGEFARVKLAISTVAARQSIPWIRRAKDDARLDLTCETKPHYCVVDGTVMDTERLGTMLAMQPPVRTLDHADAILRALSDGTIDALGTDHSPHTRAEKHYDDRMNGLWAASPGWPGLETTVSLMLTAVNEGRLSIERYAQAHSEAPARAWGLWPRKGRLGPGADADITIVDLGRRGAFDERRMHSRHPLSPFHGRAFVGAPVATIISGELIMRDGELVAREPRGRFERPG
jgi:dihydroorotase